jgi:hypothetical protein
MGKTPDLTSDILDRYLDHGFWCAKASGQAPSKRELVKFGQRHGCEFPPEYIAHATGKWRGIYIEVKEELWPRPKAYDTGEFWSFLYALFVYGFDPEAPKWMNLELATKEFRDRTGRSLIPCLKIVGDADIYVFAPTGRMARWRHETDEIEDFSGTFFDLLEQEVRDLRRRKDRKVAAP